MSPTIVNPAGLHDPVPFGDSHTATVPAGTELVLVAGQYGSGPDGAVVAPDLNEQVRQAFHTLGVALAAHAVQGGCGANPPPQTVVGGAGLARPDVLFEVEAVAVRP